MQPDNSTTATASGKCDAKLRCREFLIEVNNLLPVKIRNLSAIVRIGYYLPVHILTRQPLPCELPVWSMQKFKNRPATPATAVN